MLHLAFLFLYVGATALLLYLALSHKISKEMNRMADGLTALQQADTDLAQAITDNTTAVQAAVTDIENLSAQLSGLNTEDPAVAAIAADLETKVAALKASTTALNNAVTPPAPPAPAPSPEPAPAATLEEPAQNTQAPASQALEPGKVHFH